MMIQRMKFATRAMFDLLTSSNGLDRDLWSKNLLLKTKEKNGLPQKDIKFSASTFYALLFNYQQLGRLVLRELASTSLKLVGGRYVCQMLLFSKPLSIRFKHLEEG